MKAVRAFLVGGWAIAAGVLMFVSLYHPFSSLDLSLCVMGLSVVMHFTFAWAAGMSWSCGSRAFRCFVATLFAAASSVALILAVLLAPIVSGR